MKFPFWIFLFLQSIQLTIPEHYKGGSLSWKPRYPYSITNPIEITITERHSWTLTRYPCNDTTIETLDFYNDTENVEGPTLTCISSTALCNASLFQTISSPLYCTDYSMMFEFSTGTLYRTLYLARNSTIDIASRGSSWSTDTLTNQWSLVTHIDLTRLQNKYNTSPVTASLPIIQAFYNETIVIQILASDFDSDQQVRCRWSNQVSLDECGNACYELPNSILNPLSCSITWRPTLRSEDVANGLNTSFYIVAITAEDFINATSKTPLSSVPHQLIVNVTRRTPVFCAGRPNITGFSRRNLGCYSAGINYPYYYRFQATVYCSNTTIVEFISTSPLTIEKSEIYRLSNHTYAVNVTWTANVNQTGLQPFCVAAVDNTGQTSIQYCVMIMVGGSNQGVNIPSFVQGTASPVGTVMATQRRFTITATLPLKRTIRDGTYIQIYRVGYLPIVHQIDCKYSPDIYYINRTIVFYIQNPSWILGATYFVTMSDGVATADLYCGAESGGFSSNIYWRFTIWSPSMSSTTTPSTTTSTATTHTVTTRSISTTTFNTLFTTTGVPTVTTITTTTTTSATTTSVTTTTTTSVTTVTTTATTKSTYYPDANVIYPKDFENECLQPVTIATAIVTAATIPLHFLGMIYLFIKMESQFGKKIVQSRQKRRVRFRLAAEERQAFV